MIKDIFRDIVEHTYGVGFINLVKITGEGTELTVESMDEERTVVVTGTLPKPEKVDGVIGLARMEVLSRYLKFDGFGSTDAELITQERGDEVIPAELRFSGGGSVSNYRFMASKTVNDLIKVPPFVGVPWDVNVEPTTKALKDFSYFCSTLGKIEEEFTASTVDGKLVFAIGKGSSDNASVTFATEIDGNLTRVWSYPIQQVSSVLKLSENGNTCCMSFSSSGALKITLNSGVGEYDYIFPAR